MRKIFAEFREILNLKKLNLKMKNQTLVYSNEKISKFNFRFFKIAEFF